MKKILYLFFMLSIFLQSCDKDEERFDYKVYNVYVTLSDDGFYNVKWEGGADFYNIKISTDSGPEQNAYRISYRDYSFSSSWLPSKFYISFQPIIDDVEYDWQHFEYNEKEVNNIN